MRNIIILLMLTMSLFAAIGDEFEATNYTAASVNTDELESTDYTAEPVMSSFEKLFVNHSAYRYYQDSIKSLYINDYKTAYSLAMKAKEIIDNTEDQDQFIALPYMPSYMRETAYSPKRVYYKIVEYKPYNLKRLITKAKLISPPIASVVINRTSTYMALTIKNYGDLPLDEFKVLINDEVVGSFDKILPNEEKYVRVEKAPTLYELAFKEKYGFAPDSMMLSED